MKLYRHMSAALPPTAQLPLTGLGGDDEFVDEISPQSSERMGLRRPLEHQDSLVNQANGLNRGDTFKTANENEDMPGLNKQDTFKTCSGDNEQLISQKIMIDTTGGANRSGAGLR